MSLLTIILVLIIVGIVLWLINTYIPMQPTIKTILNIFVVIVLVIWLLDAVGVIHYLSNVRLN
jgi:hypothetical protein